MFSHHPAKFGDIRHRSSGDIMFLMVEEQDFTCLLKSAITLLYWKHMAYYALSHESFSLSIEIFS